jgi:hypothetical protein
MDKDGEHCSSFALRHPSRVTADVGRNMTMDYFENIIKRLLEEDGYWVRQSVRVNLRKEEKVEIGKASIPRPEIDIVAYNPKKNELRIIEVKSFLDSPGVKFKELNQRYKIPEGRYKLFTCTKYREILFERLLCDFRERELVAGKPSIRFGLAAGKIYSKDEQKLRLLFEKNGWILYSPADIAKALRELEKSPYENDPYVIAAKILVRNAQSDTQ